MKCTNCGSTVQDDAVFCDQCGARLESDAAPTPEAAAPATPPVDMGVAAAANLCPACGTANLPGEMFCSDCGTPLQAPMPDATVPTVAPVIEAAPVVEPVSEPVAPAETPAEIVDVPAESPTATDAAPAGPPTCAACGAELEPGDLFCHACGARVQPMPSAAPAATAAPVAAAATIAAAVTPAASAPVDVCPACGAHSTPGEVFCEFCGAALVAPAGAATVAPVAAPIASTAMSAGGGPALIVAETGQALPLSQGTEALVGREDPYTSVYPDVDLTPFGAEEKGVSRRHFKLTLAEGQYAIQDLGSTNYTWVNQQRLQPNTPVRLNDGDGIRAGRLKLVFRAR